MPRLKGSGSLGPVRSLRLPNAIDHWFEERLRDDPCRPASDVLLVLIHGGLRLRPGYMERQRSEILRLIGEDDQVGLDAYFMALHNTFNDAYVNHLKQWILGESQLHAAATSRRTRSRGLATLGGRPLESDSVDK